jgi:hypothetical protein
MLAGGIQLVMSILGVTLIGDRLSSHQNNWLLVLFQWNAGLKGVQFELLSRLDVPDLVILLLIAVLYVGLYLALRSTSRILSILALAQPFLGMLLFCLTKQAGRSGVMGAMLVISAVMLRGKLFNRTAAFTGLIAALLLLAGDLGTAPSSGSPVLAFCLAIGYMLFMVWIILVARRLFQLASQELS